MTIVCGFPACIPVGEAVTIVFGLAIVITFPLPLKVNPLYEHKICECAKKTNDTLRHSTSWKNFHNCSTSRYALSSLSLKYLSACCHCFYSLRRASGVHKSTLWKSNLNALRCLHQCNNLQANSESIITIVVIRKASKYY